MLSILFLPENGDVMRGEGAHPRWCQRGGPNSLIISPQLGLLAPAPSAPQTACMRLHTCVCASEGLLPRWVHHANISNVFLLKTLLLITRTHLDRPSFSLANVFFCVCVSMLHQSVSEVLWVFISCAGTQEAHIEL